MTAPWAKRKQWADTYWPDVERIIRRVAGQIVTIHPASLEDDQKLARDYVVASGTIACRLRKATGFRDITIRAALPRSGNTTELEKFIRGDVAWMLYGWTEEGRLGEWIFLDVGKLIEARLHEGRDLIQNYDGWSGFIAVPIAEIVAAGALVDCEIRNPTLLQKAGAL